MARAACRQASKVVRQSKRGIARAIPDAAGIVIDEC